MKAIIHHHQSESSICQESIDKSLPQHKNVQYDKNTALSIPYCTFRATSFKRRKCNASLTNQKSQLCVVRISSC